MSFTEFSGQRRDTIIVLETQLFALFGGVKNHSYFKVREGKNLASSHLSEYLLKSVWKLATFSLNSAALPVECVCVSVFFWGFCRKSSGGCVPSLLFTQKWEARGQQVVSLPGRGAFMFFCPCVKPYGCYHTLKSGESRKHWVRRAASTQTSVL